MRRKLTMKSYLFALSVLYVAVVCSLCAFATNGGDFTQKTVAPDEIAEIELGFVEGVLDGASALPKKYDLRDYKLVTPVKDQGEHGSCWAFGALAASESSLIKEFGSTYNNTLDLSELHLAYFCYNKISEPMGLINNDYAYVPKRYGSFLDLGGNTFQTTFGLSRWIGPVKESVLPYDEYKSGMTVSPASATTGTMAHLENVRWIDMKDMNAVKKTIMEKGALETSYYASDSIYLDRETGGYYYDGMIGVLSNHSVCLIGWDDGYSRENFSGGRRLRRILPKNDGAWLCKNSWGEEYCNDGYFWISYEDGVLNENFASYYDYAPVDNYDYNYQLDGGMIFSSYSNRDKISMANVFTAQHQERLEAVSFYTTAANQKCTVKIYTGVSGKASPANGKLQSGATVSKELPYAGYHTLKLPKAVSLSKGTKFSVVVELSGSKKGVTVEALTDKDVTVIKSFVNVSHAKEGQSFLSSDGKNWIDLYFYGENDNLRIKAFTSLNIVKSTSLKINEKSVNLSLGKTKKLSVTLTPSNATKSIKWTSSNKKVATVSSDGRVTAVGEGACTVTGETVYGGHKATVKIKVTLPTVSGLKATSVKSNGYTLTWSKVSGASGYRIYTYNTKTKKRDFLVSCKTNSYSFTDLKAGKTTAYCVRACVKVEGTTYYGTICEPYYVTTTVPMGKTLSVSSYKSDSCVLNWKAVKGASSYRVYLKKDGESSFAYELSTTKTTAEVTGLTPNTGYKIRVAAIIKTNSASFRGDYSNTVTLRTRPETVGGIKQKAATKSSITLSWSKAKGAVSYSVYVYNSKTKTWDKVGDTKENTFTLKKLSPKTTYSFKVSYYVKNSGVKNYSNKSATFKAKTK